MYRRHNSILSIFESMNTEWIIISSVAILAVYIYTLSPSIAGGDSGELVAEGCILGTAHPPGYPLYTIIIKLLSFFAWRDNVAYVVNAFSALCTATATFFMGYTVLLIAPASDFSVCGAIVAMGLFAFSPLIWQYAVTAEVFPMNTLFAALLIFLSVSFVRTRKEVFSLVGAFVAGLALCNQHTIVLYEIPLIIHVLYMCHSNFFRTVVNHGLVFLLGIAVYIYLPLAASIAPKQGSWGHTTSFFGLVHHILRRDYGTFQLYSGNAGTTEKFWERTLAYLYDIQWTQGFGVIPALSILGVWCSGVSPLGGRSSSGANETRAKTIRAAASASKKREDRTPFRVRVDVLLVAQVFYFLVFHSLANLPLSNKLHYGIHQRFWMQPNVLTFIWAGAGLSYVFSKIVAHLTKANTKTYRSICFALSILLVASQFRRNFYISDQSENDFFRRYATSLLAPLPKNSLLLINYDMQWTSVRYVQQCEHFRDDVTVINLSMMTYQWFEHKRMLYPHIVFPGLHLSSVKGDGAFTMFDFMEANPQLEIFLGGKLSVIDEKFTSNYDHVPIGLVSRLLPHSRMPQNDVFRNLSIEAWERIRDILPSLPPVDKYSEETWEWTIGRDYKDRVSDVAAFGLQSAISADKNAWALVDAIYWLESAAHLEEQPVAINVNGTIPTALLKNLGLGHLHLIQSKFLGAELPTPPHDLHQTLHKIPWPRTGKWKDWASNRFLHCWGNFLKRSDASLDPQYNTIRKMYETVTKKQ